MTEHLREQWREAQAIKAPKSMELGWGPRTHNVHWIARYDDGKPVAACGVKLAGLMGNLWLEVDDPIPHDLCSRCASRARNTASKTGSAGISPTLKEGDTLVCPRDGVTERVLFNRAGAPGYRFIRTNRHDHNVAVSKG